MKSKVRRTFVTVSILLALSLLSGPIAAAPLRVVDLDGRAVDPLALSAGAKAIVFVFTATDCPIANRYVPEISRLAARFAPDGVRLWLVYADPHESAAAIRDHLRRFEYRLPVLRDLHHDLVRFTKVTVSPEAAIVGPGQMLLYHGRIDDRWVDVGRDRPAPTRHDLADALGAILDGRPVVQAGPPAVGCTLADFLR